MQSHIRGLSPPKKKCGVYGDLMLILGNSIFDLLKWYCRGYTAAM